MSTLNVFVENVVFLNMELDQSVVTHSIRLTNVQVDVCSDMYIQSNLMASLQNYVYLPVQSLVFQSDNISEFPNGIHTSDFSNPLKLQLTTWTVSLTMNRISTHSKINAV